ncbi:MAG: putative signal transduction histidine kinase [Caulobacteraceae bacterium]|nr:putative signal transduction histidine kinase [Caulobacteraceae bacterium]
MATVWEFSRFPRRLRSRWARLGLALGLIIVASLSRMALGVVDWRIPPFSLYLPAILLATLVGGWKAGAAATALSLLLAWFLFVGPWVDFGAPAPLAWLAMAVDAGTALAIVVVAGYLHVLMGRLARSQAALSERNLTYDAVFQTMSEGFALCEATWDEDGRLTDYVVLEMNPALQAMLGVGPEAVGRRLSDAAGDHGPWLALCDRVLKTGAPRSFENLNPDTGRWHEVHVTRVTPTRMGQLFFDVTELKAAQARQAEMFDELNHRVKNNLGIVIALLNMQARAGGPVLRTALGKAVDRVQSIAAVHESLSAHHNSGEVDFGGYLRNLVERLSRSILGDGRIGIDVEASSWPLSIDHAVALGIVVNELVTNAAKYAYPAPRTGSIRIRFRPVDSGALLTVCDNGCGLPADFATAGGLGAKLVKSFVAQVGGELTIRHQPGAAFQIWLPTPAPPNENPLEPATRA